MTAYRQALGQYDGLVQRVVEEFTSLVSAVYLLDGAVTADDDAEVDVALDALDSSADDLLDSVHALEQKELELLAGATSTEGMITQAVAVVAAGLVIYGIWEFGSWLKKKSTQATAERKKRDDALVGIANNTPGADESYKAAKKELNTIRDAVILETSTKVVTELVLTPVSPVSVAGKILKDKAGNLLGKGIKVLTTTLGCKPGGSKPDSPKGDYAAATCRIAVQTSDSQSRVTLPAGDQSVLISAPGKARIAIPEEPVTEGQDTAVERELIPVEQATPEKVQQNDEGTYTPTSDPPPPNPDGGTGDLGPQCTKLATCCPKITDLASLKASCDKTLADGSEAGCSIMVSSVSRLGYCER